MTDQADLSSRIAALEARFDIQELIYNYGKATDAADHDEGHRLFVSLFAEDCTYTIPKFGIEFKGNGDNAPVFDETDSKKVIEPGGVGWMYSIWIYPGQEECFSLMGNVDVKVTGDTATGIDYMARIGYNSPKPADATPNDLGYTYAIHRYKFAKINGTWKITWFEGNPVHNTAVIK